MEKMYCFIKNNKIFTNEYKTNHLHPDGKLYLYRIFLDDKEITKANHMIRWLKKSNNHFHLDYIGFKREFRNKGLLKSYIHPHCTEHLKNKGVEKITLKPLSTAFIVWISLGFEIENEIEELQIKQIIKEFLLEKGIKTEDFGKMCLKDIIIAYKKNLKNEDFPPKLEKVYYTNLKKVIKWEE